MSQQWTLYSSSGYVLKINITSRKFIILVILVSEGAPSVPAELTLQDVAACSSWY